MVYKFELQIKKKNKFLLLTCWLCHQTITQPLTNSTPFLLSPHDSPLQIPRRAQLVIHRRLTGFGHRRLRLRCHPRCSPLCSYMRSWPCRRRSLRLASSFTWIFQLQRFAASSSSSSSFFGQQRREKEDSPVSPEAHRLYRVGC